MFFFRCRTVGQPAKPRALNLRSREYRDPTCFYYFPLQNVAVAGSTKRLASLFYQLKTGHCLSGQYLHWTKNRTTRQCRWCRYRTQTRDHLFKECLEWKPQQKILWAEVKKETGRWRTGGGSGTSWRTRDVGGRSWTSSPHGCGKAGAGRGRRSERGIGGRAAGVGGGAGG